METVNLKRQVKLYFCGSHNKEKGASVSGPLVVEKVVISHKALTQENMTSQLVQAG